MEPVLGKRVLVTAAEGFCQLSRQAQILAGIQESGNGCGVCRCFVAVDVYLAGKFRHGTCCCCSFLCQPLDIPGYAYGLFMVVAPYLALDGAAFRHDVNHSAPLDDTDVAGGFLIEMPLGNSCQQPGHDGDGVDALFRLHAGMGCPACDRGGKGDQGRRPPGCCTDFAGQVQHIGILGLYL